MAVYLFERQRTAELSAAPRRAPAGRQLGGEHAAQLPRRRRRRARRQRPAADGDRRGQLRAAAAARRARRGRGGRGARAPRRPSRSRPSAVELAVALVEQAATALALARARAEAGTDAVTGCMNHRAMRRRLDEEIGRATRTGGPLSCLLIDLDDFKLVNDRHGHQAGDAMLRARRARARGRVPRVRSRCALRRRRVRRDPAQRRAGQRRRRGRAGRSSACARSRRTTARAGVSASIGVAQWQRADEHRRAARSLRRSAAALQAPGQGARDPRLRARQLSASLRPAPLGHRVPTATLRDCGRSL